MPKKSSGKLGHITEKALELLRKHPHGLSMRQMRQMTGSTESQEHFNRRVRDIRKLYHMETRREGGVHIYILGKPKKKLSADSGAITEKLRAEIIHAAHGRCQMCGNTVSKDHIKLQVDHRLPQSWGGKTERDNLWAICEACNRGKKHFFSSFNKLEMRKVLAFKSVHERIAHMLRLRMNKPVPSYLLQFVANALEQQEDWHRRLRELRSPVIGFKIDVSKKRGKKGVESFYTLRNWRTLPDDPTRIIREYEKKKKSKKPT
jgi:hypothetical protein